eukprot:m.107428 g.107428  ORF g.107428 m.107428 type:complete len:62 (+) comp13927_c0_seq3:1345-1530(+)
MVPGYHLMPPLHRASTRFTSLLTKSPPDRFDLQRRCDTEEIYGAFQPRNNFARVDCAPETV